MKRCTKCKEKKPLEDFAKNRARPDGLQGMCRLCKKGYNAEYYRDNRTEQIKRAARLRDRQRSLLREYVHSIKLVPCADCKKTYIPFAMDFDHVRGKKTGNISQMVNSAVKMDTLLTEISKCDIVCATCHRIRTYNRIMGHKH